jgi:hypothetical protein
LHWSGVAANAIQDALGIPYVVTEHMTRYAAGKVVSENLPLMRKVFSEARMRLPIGESTGEFLEKIFGDDFRPWTVIPNMVVSCKVSWITIMVRAFIRAFFALLERFGYQA